MTLSLLLTLVLSGGPSTDYALGEQAFASGQFSRALQHLEAAARQTSEPGTLSAIQLLRGQAYAALHQPEQAQAAFEVALRYDPEARLDPVRVPPSVVGLLESVRERSRGELEVVASGNGGVLYLDGRLVGPLPFRGPAPLGRHRLELRGTGGQDTVVREVVIRMDQTVHLDVALPAPVAQKVTANPDRLRLDVDARAMGDVLHGGVALEAGGGLGGRYWMVTLHGVWGAAPGLTLRVAGRLPGLLGPVGAYASLDGVLFFSNSVLAGGGGSLGLLCQLPWELELFAEAAGRYVGSSERFHTAYLLVGGGVRMSFF